MLSSLPLHDDAFAGPLRSAGSTEAAPPVVALLTQPQSFPQVAHHPQLENARLMVVDDDLTNAKMAYHVLRRAGYQHVIVHQDSETAVDAIRLLRPDLVLCDVCMPVSGLDVLREVMIDRELQHIPLVMITASDDETLRAQALELGATDLLTKPLRATELLPRVRNALLVRYRTAELVQSRQELIHCLARLAEYRDNETGLHVLRVGRYSGLLARSLGLDEMTAQLIEQAAPLHDIGKIGIPDAILLKPGKLTPEEYETMQRHVALGKQAFDPMSPYEAQHVARHTQLGEGIFRGLRSPLLAMASEIALTHHERWDGNGYPIGLAREEIPISGRIVAVADVFDALSNKRPYKPAFPIERCLQILDEGSGTQFDPRVVQAFHAVREKIVEIRMALADIN